MIKIAKGSTLAEMLITLVIIGIIAAITIPSLIQSSGDAQIVAAVKKTQTTLSQAVQHYMVDNSCIGNLANCGAFDNGIGNTAAKNQAAWNQIKIYFNITKDCGTAANQGCFPDVMYKSLNNNPLANYNSNSYTEKALLADGTKISFIDDSGNCYQDYSSTELSPLKTVCATLNIDVNGQKGTNQRGRDLFIWRFANNGAVYPGASLDENLATDANVHPLCLAGSDLGCTAKVIIESTIKY